MKYMLAINDPDVMTTHDPFTQSGTNTYCQRCVCAMRSSLTLSPASLEKQTV